jgi:general secretion pathway protein D
MRAWSPFRTLNVSLSVAPLLLLAAARLPAQSATGAAGTEQGSAAPAPVSSRQSREAEDAYLAGARHVEHRDLDAAERDFGRALRLNPSNTDYAQAVAVTRQQRVTELVEAAARARVGGDNAHSLALLAEAETLDPGNPLVEQHLGPAARNEPIDLFALPADRVGGALAGPVELTPSGDLHSFHVRASEQQMLRDIYNAYGIRVVFDDSFTSNASIRLDMDDVNFADATRVVREVTRSFDVPVQATSAMIALDTQENRDRLEPQVEETIYLPGMSSDQMAELANVARNVFDLRRVTASPASGGILVSGDPATLKLLNATYDDMLDGGSDVLLDIRIYEVSKSHDVHIGAQLPSSAGIFSIAAEAATLVNQNASLIAQAVASGVLTLNGTPLQNLIKEVAFLVASGSVNVSQYTNLLGTLGGGLTLSGLYLGSNASFNLLLNSSETRLLDAVTLRAGNRQAANFRAGSRYPVITASYSSGVSSALASQLAGLNVNGTSVSSLLSQYLGSTSVTVPQFQYEDLGLTLKATPTIQPSGIVTLQLDMKLEALGGTSLNSIPVLNSRTLNSTVEVPVGQTALLASLVNGSEMRSVQGVPGLSALPGFQGSDKEVQTADDELLISITPHIVRAAALSIASRRLAMPHVAGGPAPPQ